MAPESRRIAGIILILVPAVAFGGASLLSMIVARSRATWTTPCARTCGGPATPMPGSC